MDNLYKVLGVCDFASVEDIKTAYKKLSKKFHPDLNDGDKFFEEKFKEIQNAYQCLIDVDTRIRYDESLKRYYRFDTSNKKSAPEEESFKPEPKAQKDNSQSNTSASKITTETFKLRVGSFKMSIYGITVLTILFLVAMIHILNQVAERDKNNLDLTQEVSTEYDLTSGLDTINLSDQYIANSELTSSLDSIDYPDQYKVDSQAIKIEPSVKRYKEGIRELQRLREIREIESLDNKSVNEDVGFLTFFRIGSSKKEVLEVQGTPSEINNYEALGKEVWNYGNSSVTFKLGKVTEYSNRAMNLKIKI